MLTRQLRCRRSGRWVTTRTSATAAQATPLVSGRPAASDPWRDIFDTIPEDEKSEKSNTNNSNSSLQSLRHRRSHSTHSSEHSYFTRNNDLIPPSLFFYRNTRTAKRSFGTSAIKSRATPTSDPPSTWDEIFDDDDDNADENAYVMPPRPPHNSSNPPPRSRRLAMTAREIKAFDDMFNMIFNSVSPSSSTETTETVNLPQHHPRKPKIHLPRALSFDEELLLDEKKEDIEVCFTDYEVLQWAEQELFQDSVKRLKAYEEYHSAQTSTSTSPPATPSLPSSSTKQSTPGAPIKDIQSPIYAPLLTHVINLLVTKFQNPDLACALFVHAAQLSFPSYIYACTTPSWNAYLEALWKATNDLRLVNEALTQMWRDGVRRGIQTRNVILKIREQVEQILNKGRHLVIPADKSMSTGSPKTPEATTSSQERTEPRIWDMEEGEVLKMLEQMEALCVEDPTDAMFSPSNSSSWTEKWKAEGRGGQGPSAPKNNEKEVEGTESSWKFNNWNEPRPRRGMGRGMGRGFSARPTLSPRRSYRRS